MAPYDVVREFEETIADYAGAKYGVAVESCTAALLLSCSLRRVGLVKIPKHTYPSVPCSIIHAGGHVEFTEDSWDGLYELSPWDIWDGSLRFCRNMYKRGLHCLSFHIKKLLPIGRGGMILCETKQDMEWLKRARFDGRSESPLQSSDITMVGWNCYLQVEQASRGLLLFNAIKDKNLPDLDSTKQGYPDLSSFSFYR